MSAALRFSRNSNCLPMIAFAVRLLCTLECHLDCPGFPGGSRCPGHPYERTMLASHLAEVWGVMCIRTQTRGVPWTS